MRMAPATLSRQRRLAGCLLWTALLLVLAPAWAKPVLFLGNARIPPVVFQSGEGAMGVAVDLTRALASHVGLEAEVRAEDWPHAQQQVLAGTADALIQINPTPERETLYDFSDVLLESNFNLFVRSGYSPVRDLASLDGKRVGVEGGGFPMTFLVPHREIALVTVPSWNKAFEMLRDGQLDAVFVDRWVGEYQLSLGHIEGIAVVEPALVSSQSRIAVRKGNTELLARINQGLAAIAQDGTRQAVLERWQGKQVVYVTRQEYERTGWVLALLVIGLLSLGLVTLLLHIRQVRRRNADLVLMQAQLHQALDNRTQALQAATEAKAAQEVLLAEQRAVLSSDFIGLLRLDLDARTLLWANNVACRMLGYASGALEGLSTRALFAGEEGYANFGKSTATALRNGRTVHEEIQLKRQDGSTGWYQISASLLKEPVAVAAVVDVTERKLMEDEAAYLAYFDPLTGLANRRMLASRIHMALAQSRRSAKHGALMFLDLDNFKPLNDRYGHELGDQLLKEVAHRLVACVREVDTVARFGGDEFVVLLSELDTDTMQAQHMAAEVAEKIRKSLAAPYHLEPTEVAEGAAHGVKYRASASIGVVLFGLGLPSASVLLMRGDAAMYLAKAAGRDQVKFAP